MSHNTLENYYKLIFALAHHHKYSISELENMVPFERDIYTEFVKKFLKEKEEEAKKQRGLIFG